VQVLVLAFFQESIFQFINMDPMRLDDSLLLFSRPN